MAAAAKTPFRIVDGMILVAAMAVAFALFRAGLPQGGGLSFTTFGGRWEQWLFFWMHHAVPFPVMGSLAVFLLAMRGPGARRRARCAGIAACAAAAGVAALAAIISSCFYVLHILEDVGAIPKVLSHGIVSHQPPPFGGTPLEEIAGGAVAGAWAALIAARRWRAEPSWLDRAGRALGAFWVALLLIYLYGYAG